MKPAKLVKSATLRSPAGARDIDFGASKAESRAGRDYSKDACCSTPSKEYDDDKARMKRWGAGTY